MGLTSQLNRKYRALIAAGVYPICYLCGKPITKQNDVSQDHILALARHGETSEENLCVSHKLCNSMKGMLTLQQWFDLQAQRQRT